MGKSYEQETLHQGTIRKLRKAGVITRKGRGDAIIYQKRTLKKASISPLQQAWTNDFVTAQQQSKNIGPNTYNQAKAFADSNCAGLTFWRDYINTARAGKLISSPVTHALARNPLLSRRASYPEIFRVTTPTASVYRTSAQSLTPSVNLYLTPNTAYWDNNAFWSPTTNPTRLTVKAQGLYLVGANLRFSAVSGAQRQLNLVVNRTDVIGSQFGFPTQAAGLWMNAVGLWYFNPDDYLEVRAYSNAGGVSVTLANLWMVAITPEGLLLP